MRNYVIINGTNSLTIQGLAISSLPSISKPAMRTLREEIDGRNGDIVTELGYSAYDKTMAIGLFGSFDINEVIAFFNQSGTIVFSDEPDKYYNFNVLEQIDFEKLVKFRTASINFHCQPFKYPLNETPLEEVYEYVDGEGTELTLNDTANAIFNKFDVLGNTSQVQYTGKNLLPFQVGYTETKNGVTLVVKQDGIYLNGTPTISSGYITFNYNISLNTGYYTSFFPENMVGLGIQFPNGNLNFGMADTTPTIRSTNITSATSGVGSINVRYDVGALNNKKITPMLLQGTFTTQQTYEPYVGGTASPNPSYPQNVNVVSGDNEIKICGKNLFTTGNGSSTKIGVNATYNESEVILNGTTTGAGNIFYDETISINTGYRKSQTLPAGTYTLSTKTTGTATYPSGIGIAMYIRDGNGNILKSFSSIANYQTTLTLNSETIIYSQLYINGSGGVYNNYSIRIQIEKGNQATTYEPYIGNSYPLYLGVENLCKPITTATKSGITMTNNGDGSYTLNGTATANTSFYNATLGLEIDTYTFSANNPVANSNGGFYFQVEYQGGGVTAQTFNDVNAKKTFTTTKKIIAWVIVVPNGITLNNFVIKPQLEKGSKVNSFTPYGVTPIELCKIGTYQDYIYKDNGSWYLHKEIGKVVLDGSEVWIYYTSTNKPVFYIDTTVSTNIVNYLQESGLTCFANYYQGKGQKATFDEIYDYGNNVIGFRTGQYKRLVIRNDNITNLENFKTWLSTHSVEVYYVLATPTNTEITDTNLIEQLESLSMANSIQGQTNISQENNDLPFILSVSTLKDGSDHLVINNIGNIYAKPTLDLEGSGIVDIYLNDTQMFEVDLSETNEIIINTQEMEAYNPTTNALANRQVVGDYSKFKLDSGENDLRFSGALTKATITNYQRWL